VGEGVYVNNKQERDLSEAGIIEWHHELPEIIAEKNHFFIKEKVRGTIDAREWTEKYAKKYARALGRAITLASYLSYSFSESNGFHAGEIFFCAHTACRADGNGNICDIADYGTSSHVAAAGYLHQYRERLFIGDQKKYENIIAKASNTAEDVDLVKARLVLPDVKEELGELYVDLKNGWKVDRTRQKIEALEAFLVKYDKISE
jgi:hypothetical protein